MAIQSKLHRVRGGTASFDDSSDEETEVEITSIRDPDTRKVKTHYVQFTSSASLSNADIPSLSLGDTSILLAKTLLSEFDSPASPATGSQSKEENCATVPLPTATPDPKHEAPKVQKPQSFTAVLGKLDTPRRMHKHA
ncbi:hypothetical protein DFP72DRAFT_853942 [Ephemerocybe angulata]|uniref:Uncharacterized protein n=1 Tax=Ephemerocybe angulata TaxID=980116 RepID=A0A8H6HKB1_9AGAR|nr:hypothetical protein DFP72DRAFT_853942 [Tulosesus angulatus]